jgi:mannose-6-phosphate isomerase-like protein (cupin superfamily)
MEKEMIDFLTLDQVKVVSKPWGWEKWLQAGDDVYPFCLKQLLLQAGNKTSLQVHQHKSESIIILSGTGTLLTYDEHFDCEKYLAGYYTENDLYNIIENLRTIQLKPNDVFHTPPGTIHRMIANSDLLYIEASTTQLDDVIRLQDDKNRQHGRIENEHE